MDLTINPIPHRTSFNLKKANWDRYRKRQLLTNCQKGEMILRTIILKAASQHIPSGRHRINTELVPAVILERMRARDDFRSRYHTSPALQHMNDDITRTTNEHRRKTWGQFVETLDRPFQTVENYQGNRPQKDENEAITFATLKYLPQSRLPIISTDSSPHQRLADTPLPVRPDQCLEEYSENHWCQWWHSQQLLEE